MNPTAEPRRPRLDPGTIDALSPAEVVAWLQPIVGSQDAETADADLVARAHGYLSGALLQDGQESAAFEHAVKAVRYAEATTAPETRARAWLAIGNTFFAVGQMAEALRWQTRAAALDGAEAATVFHARTNRAATLRADGRLDAAADAFDELRASGAPISPSRHAAMLINAASCYHQVDRVPEARLTLADARGELAGLSRPDLVAWCDAIEAWVEAEYGTPERTRELAHRVLEDPCQQDTFLRSSAARALAQAALGPQGHALLSAAADALRSLHQECRTSSAHQVGLDLSLALAQVEEARGDLAAAVQAHRDARGHGERVQRQTRRLDLALDFQRVELARLQVEAETTEARWEELAEANRGLAAEAAERQRRLRALAHDVRNPLAAILAAAEFSSICDAERKDRLWGSVQSAAQRAVAVLDTALQEAPEGQLRGDLGSAAREVLLAFRALADRRDVRITVEGPLSCPVFCGATALGRILDNLVSNALKFSPVGGRVSVLLAAKDDLVELLVLDEGPGFGEDATAGVVLGKQLHGSDGGWGIGLHTVYRLVADHGGSLALTDRAEGGASVRVRFPRAQ